jgi:pimeloyl-ACP methyl ester carboxylesterase
MKITNLHLENKTNSIQPLNYLDKGSGKPVILIHGIAASLNDWHYLIPELTTNGFHAFALDLLGHGKSPKPDDPDKYHFESLYQNLENWIKSLSLEDPAILVGHSLGGTLSLNYARHHPERIDRLILIDPFYDRTQLAPILRAANRRPNWIEKAIRFMPPWIFNTVMSWDIKPMNDYSPAVRIQIAEDYRQASPHIFRITNTVPYLLNDLDGIHIPTLVIWGDRDFTLDPQSFSVLVKELPEAKSQVIPNCGHQPHLARSDEFNQIVLDFLME